MWLGRKGACGYDCRAVPESESIGLGAGMRRIVSMGSNPCAKVGAAARTLGRGA